MKILQVVQTYYPNIGGVEEHVRRISEIIAKDHEVTVFTTDPSGKLPKTEIINGVTIKRFKSYAPNTSYFLSEDLRKFLRQSYDKFDVVHAHNYHAFPALYAANGNRKNKFVFTPHYHGAGLTFFRSLVNRPYKLIGKKIFKNADMIICVSKYEKNLLTKNFRVNLEKVTIIPNGVDPSEFSNLKKENRISRTILFVGRLEKYKGMHYLIKALPHLSNDINLEFIGDGSYKEQLINLAQKHHLTDRIRFYKNLSRAELLQEYVNADLFALLSRHEAYGISVAEALAAGVPCLVANSSALTEWIDNVNCFGINLPINVDELVIRVNEIIGKKVNNPNLPNWNDIAKLVIKTYDGLFLK